MTAAVLAALALLLSGPVPAGLARWPRLRRVPRAAVLLWQAIALAAVLSALGASLALATGPLLSGSPEWWKWVVSAASVSVTVVVAARLLWCGHVVGRRLRTLRRRHRELVDLLASPDADLRVLEHETPLAYCVPGLRHRSRLVLSSATVTTLQRSELAAVVAHERAHLHARHDLVLEAFTVVHRAFPRWVSSGAALREVQLLVELLADRSAVRRVGARPLARALVSMAGSPAPESALAASGAGLTRSGSGLTASGSGPAASGSGLMPRVELLADDGRHPWLALTTYAAAALVLVLPTVLVALPWLTDLWSRY